MRAFLQKWFAPAEARDDPNLGGVLEEAAAGGGCPVCGVRDRRVERHEFTILWEEVNDPGLRETLLASWGFTRTHAWQMASSRFMGVGAPFGLAIIYRDLVRRLARALTSPPVLAQALKPTRADPVQGSEDEAVEDFTHVLAVRSRDAAFRARYVGWDGACLPHGFATIAQAAPAPARWLRLDMVHRLEERVAGATDADGLAWLAAFLVGDPLPAAEGGWAKPWSTFPETPDLLGLLALPGCPLCNAEVVAARSALEGAASDADDLCFDHTWLLVHLVRTRAIPLAQATTVLDGMAARWRDRLAATSANGRGLRTCPVCVAVHKAAGTIGRELLDRIEDEHVQEAVARSGGVCLPHLRRLLSVQYGNLPALVAIERAVAEALLGELDEFIRKHDYRFANEAKGDEGTSWYRAIRLLAGNPPIRNEGPDAPEERESGHRWDG
jgi:hypothetical protein